MPQASFLQVKAFGDLVIANAAAERVLEADRTGLTLAIGEHLRSLCETIEPKIKVIELPTVETGVPSLFDVRRNGPLSAIRSALQVRRAIERAPIDSAALLLFDRLGWRERFIAGTRSAAGMPTEIPNIYDGYDHLLVGAGFRLVPPMATRASPKRHIGIFPGSRIASKNLPAALICEIIQELERAGIVSTLFLLVDERPDLEASGLPHVMIPRQFSVLRDAISSVDALISADSLPAHLAESFQIDSFVFTPRPNNFWMPRSVLINRRWCLFNDPDRLQRLRLHLLDDQV